MKTDKKIEKILLKHSPYVFFGNAVKTELFGETVKHLTTLIQEERKDSFRGFMDWRKKILEKTLSKSEVECIMADYGIGFEEYLESEGK